MRFVNADGRAGLVIDGRVLDVDTATSGRVPADPMTALFSHLGELEELARGATSVPAGPSLDDVRLGPPIPAPPMIVSVVANFPHAERPVFPMIVDKAPSAINGPFDKWCCPPGPPTA